MAERVGASEGGWRLPITGGGRVRDASWAKLVVGPPLAFFGGGGMFRFFLRNERVGLPEALSVLVPTRKVAKSLQMHAENRAIKLSA